MRGVGVALESVLKFQKKIFFLLAFLTGMVVLSNYSDFQVAVAQGDHGRDLYAFKRVLEGAVPYRDFSWLFGPLMAYYYAFFFKLLQTHLRQAQFWHLFCDLLPSHAKGSCYRHRCKKIRSHMHLRKRQIKSKRLSPSLLDDIAQEKIICVPTI